MNSFRQRRATRAYMLGQAGDPMMFGVTLRRAF